ncbi:unnamed protein product [Rhizoctonia solani]|uniref:Calcipressin n=1 Tax=Rhizoctonia solani TaxID=456999 RepID=A0A8H3BWA8_9AGAM|nr:unnamed protein product [Rhizoctonia solani]
MDRSPDVNHSHENASALPPATEPQATNTLIIPSLPASFFEPLVLKALRDLFASYGHLHSWAPLRGLARIILVYWDNQNAEDAKIGTDGLTLGHDSNGGAPTPTRSVEPSRLAVPALEKNFLISPPGSPPVGWEPVVEDPPNKDALASDLIEALRRLQLSREGGVEVLVSSSESGVPAVHLEGEWDEDESVGRGGSGISMVKATVASMGGPGSGIATPVGESWLNGERVSVRKIPTARPPLPNQST